MIKVFRRAGVKSGETRQLQDAVAATLATITNKQILDGRLVEDKTLTTGDNSIEHGLNRILRGWIVVRKSAAVTIYDKQSTNDLDNRFLVLNSSGAATVSLWVF